jgi:SAM-dependent methyltransferase
LLGRILPSVTSACDLACGTGTTALQLAGAGIKTFAVDLSPAMCRLAREKASRAHLPVRVFCADMRNFRLPEPVDLITCEFDALNHVPRKEDLRLVAKSVARALRPGGYFFFDVNNRAGFERFWSGTFSIERPGIVAVMRSGHDSRRDTAWSDVEMFIREGKLWRRRRESVNEVCWSAGEIRRTLRDEGFNSMRAWDATPFFQGNPIIRPGCRTFYLARKEIRKQQPQPRITRT